MANPADGNVRRCSITKVVEFDSGHRVPTHRGQCRHLHGHRYRVEATFTGPVPGSGMVVDFAVLKDLVKQASHDRWDHRFLVWSEDTPLLDLHRQARAAGPASAAVDDSFVVVPYVPTAENMVCDIYQTLCSLLAQHPETKDCAVERIKLYETPNSYAAYPH